VFESASCDPAPAIDLRIDATLDSEVFEATRCGRTAG
jgi:hypothetical protein